MLVAKRVLIVGVLAPCSVAMAQLSGGIGPVGQLSSAAASNWRTSAALSGAARFDNSFSSAEVSGQLSATGGAFRFGSLAGRHQFFTPSIRGLRAITSLEFTGPQLLDPLAASRVRGSSSLSYRNGPGGAWAGVVAERGMTSALRTGGWRQLGSALTFAIASSLRRGTYGKTGPRTWTGTYRDSIQTDSGWVYLDREGIFGDSGSAGRKLSWLETEATLGWSRGRVAFDVVGGWRPPIDSAPRATWFRAMTTVAISRSVALTAGVGTTMRQIPFARTTGRYASVAVRLAPAALVRPKEIPEITPTASAFKVERAGEQYLVRVRLPQARTVELSGDFNGWQPVRLSREIDGSWTASLALKPGTYRMNLRVDGEQWLPPPGAPAVDDEFNGRVGLVVVR